MAPSLLARLGTFFYVVHPNSTTFRTAEEVPNYTNEAVPLFIAFLILEWIVLRAKNKKKNMRTNDVLTSVGHGIVYEVIGFVIRGTTLIGYEWLYKHRLIDLDWDSPAVWWLAALGIDFGYYWFHRAAHEVNIIWGAHQVHHSSEDYNLSTALRQSIFQRYFSFGFYHPLALLGVPLPAMLVHQQFNLIYQFWIHTELVKDCGPLEWILNTPSHHRVHHGANKWCLDKNYAGVLIIWDRIFGTFEPEREDEKIAYGLVTQPQKFNVLYLQVFYFRAIFEKALSMPTWGDTFRALCYGPGWVSGTPRLGDPSTFPDVTAPRPKYDPQLPLWHEIYVVVHFVAILIMQQVFVAQYATFSWYTVLMFIFFLLVSVGIIGAMYDGWWWAPLVEAVRCASYVAYAKNYPVTSIPTLDSAILAYFAMSTLLWTSQSLSVIQATAKNSKLH